MSDTPEDDQAQARADSCRAAAEAAHAGAHRAAACWSQPRKLSIFNAISPTPCISGGFEEQSPPPVVIVTEATAAKDEKPAATTPTARNIKKTP